MLTILVETYDSLGPTERRHNPLNPCKQFKSEMQCIPSYSRFLSGLNKSSKASHRHTLIWRMESIPEIHLPYHSVSDWQPRRELGEGNCVSRVIRAFCSW